MTEIQSIGKCVLKSPYLVTDPAIEKKMALIVSIVRGMEGCLGIDVLMEIERPNTFHFYTRWQSQKAYDARLTPEYFKALAVFKDTYVETFEFRATRFVNI